MNTAGPPRAPDLVVAMTGASGAPYAVRLLQVVTRFDRTIHLTVSSSAVQVLREELGLEVSLDAFNPAFCGSQTRASGLPSLPGLQCVHRQRVVSDGWNGHYSVQHEHAGCDRRRDDVEPDHARGGCSSEGAAQADPGAAGNSAESDPSREHGEGHPRGAVVLPAMPGWYHRPRQIRDLIDFIVARICDQIGIPNALVPRWGTDINADALEKTQRDSTGDLEEDDFDLEETERDPLGGD